MLGTVKGGGIWFGSGRGVCECLGKRGRYGKEEDVLGGPGCERSEESMFARAFKKSDWNGYCFHTSGAYCTCTKNRYRATHVAPPHSTMPSSYVPQSLLSRHGNHAGECGAIASVD